MTSRTTRSNTLGPSPIPSSTRSLRSRNIVPTSTPETGMRGMASTSYGSNEISRANTGLVDAGNRPDLADILKDTRTNNQEKDEAKITKEPSKISTRESTREPTRAQSSTRLESLSPSVQKSTRASSTKSKSRSRSKSRSKSRGTPFITINEDEDEDETDFSFPSGGINPISLRNFDQLYEGGLEDSEDIPAFIALIDALFSTLWVVLYAFPIILALVVAYVYAPWFWNKVSSESTSPLVISPSVSSVFETVTPQNVPIEQPIVTVITMEESESTLALNPAIKTDEFTSISTPKSSSASSSSSSSSAAAFRLWDNTKARELDSLKLDLSTLKQQVRLLTSSLQLVSSRQSEDNRLNFFSPNLGATIDPYYTGPTHPNSVGWARYMFDTIIGHVPGPWHANPPIRALTSWRENGECWCGAPAKNGALSLGIILNRPVKPRALVIDHVSKEFALDIRSAPKIVNFWGHVVDKFPPESVWPESDSCDRKLKPRSDKLWICLGQIRYDTEGEETAQRVRVSRYGIEAPFAVDQVVVQVIENWGKEYTCLYQVKLEGIMNEE